MPITIFSNEAVTLRMERALFAMAPNVMLAGGTTLLGVCVLAFSSSPVFRMFFWLVLVLVLAAVLHALIFVPVLLTFFPPAPSQKGVDNTTKHPNRPSSMEAITRRRTGKPTSYTNNGKISPEEEMANNKGDV